MPIGEAVRIGQRQDSLTVGVCDTVCTGVEAFVKRVMEVVDSRKYGMVGIVDRYVSIVDAIGMVTCRREVGQRLLWVLVVLHGVYKGHELVVQLLSQHSPSAHRWTLCIIVNIKGIRHSVVAQKPKPCINRASMRHEGGHTAMAEVIRETTANFGIIESGQASGSDAGLRVDK